jgi:hypothetical protein
VQTETNVRMDLSARGNIDCCFSGRSIDRCLRTRVLWKTNRLQGKQDSYVARNLIERGRDLLLSAPSIIMRSKVNGVRIDIVPPDPTAQAVEAWE